MDKSVGIKCDLILVRQEGDRYVHKCIRCKRERKSTYEDSSLVKAICSEEAIKTVKYPEEGVGTELVKILERLGAEKDGCGSCGSHALLMNAWGPDECWRRKDEIVGWLRKAYKQQSLLKRIQIVGLAGLRVMQGELSINQCPYESALKHAIDAWKGK